MMTKLATSLYLSVLAVACTAPVNAQPTRKQATAVMRNAEAKEVCPYTKMAPFAPELMDEVRPRHPEVMLKISNQIKLETPAGNELFAAVAQVSHTAPEKPHTFAQKLVDEELAKHPDIVILVFHVVNKDESDYPIIASNIGRYGKKADEDDLRVIQTGKPNLEVNAAGNHFEVEMALHDASQRTLGAIAVVYNYKNGDSKEALQKKAESVRAEVERQIPSLDKLLEAAQ